MINSTVRHEPKPFVARVRFAAALVLAVSSWASCGGGGGGSHGASSVRVDAVQPGVGAFIGGTHVTVQGLNFVPDIAGGQNTVQFGGHPATNVVAVDDHTRTCATPAGTPGATVDVVVQNVRGSGRLIGGFTYLSPAPPTSDVNGDGIADLIVAAPFDASSGPGAGAWKSDAK